MADDEERHLLSTLLCNHGPLRRTLGRTDERASVSLKLPSASDPIARGSANRRDPSCVTRVTRYAPVRHHDEIGGHRPGAYRAQRWLVEARGASAWRCRRAPWSDRDRNPPRA